MKVRSLAIKTFGSTRVTLRARSRYTDSRATGGSAGDGGACISIRSALAPKRERAGVVVWHARTHARNARSLPPSPSSHAHTRPHTHTRPHAEARLGARCPPCCRVPLVQQPATRAAVVKDHCGCLPERVRDGPAPTPAPACQITELLGRPGIWLRGTDLKGPRREHRRPTAQSRASGQHDKQSYNHFTGQDVWS